MPQIDNGLAQGHTASNCRTRNLIQKWITTNPVLSYYFTLIFLYRGKNQIDSCPLWLANQNTLHLVSLNNKINGGTTYNPSTWETKAGNTSV